MLKRRCKLSKYDLGKRISRERKRALKRLPSFCSGFTKNIPLWYLKMERLGIYWYNKI